MRKGLRKLKPSEQDIQAGALELLGQMHEVAWAHKQFVGEGVIVRPLAPDISVRTQLDHARALGCINGSQIAYIKGAPKGVLDIALQLNWGAHGELEAKRPGEKPTKEQNERMELIRANGGFADWFTDVEQVQGIIRQWSLQHSNKRAA